jgi:hypothetical protein|tara:strand:- start:291 stop:434 length:144 start_codon:yes stop_codon:yes gene_type:complete
MIMKYVLRDKQTDQIVVEADRMALLMEIRVEENLISSTYIDMVEVTA